MTKFSDFIREPGTAGPPTKEGIRALGFALLTDFPEELAGYLYLLADQLLSPTQMAQGRENLGLGTIATQNANAVALTGGSITGITDLAIADGGTGASTAPAARMALGLGNVDNTADSAKPVSTAQQTALNLKANLASPALTGTPTVPTAAPGTNTTQAASTAFVGAAVAAALPVKFVSADQTIASGAQRIIPHGLGVMPDQVQLRIKCLTAEEGFTVGQEVMVGFQDDLGSNVAGVSCIVDATNLTIRYGAAASVFIVPNASNGGRAGLTNARWALIARAFR